MRIGHISLVGTRPTVAECRRYPYRLDRPRLVHLLPVSVRLGASATARQAAPLRRVVDSDTAPAKVAGAPWKPTAMIES